MKKQSQPRFCKSEIYSTNFAILMVMWDRFVDFITVVWLTVFFVGIANPGLTPDYLELGLLSVFVLDLVVKYRREPNIKTFVRKRWVDILMVIPYFRIFRMLKLFRLIRVLKAAKVFRVRKFPGLKVIEAFRRKSLRIVNQLRSRRVKR